MSRVVSFLALAVVALAVTSCSSGARHRHRLRRPQSQPRPRRALPHLRFLRQAPPPRGPGPARRARQGGDRQGLINAVTGDDDPRLGRSVSAYGVADRATGAAMGTALHYRIASVSKTFTAYAILRLVDEEARPQGPGLDVRLEHPERRHRHHQGAAGHAVRPVRVALWPLVRGPFCGRAGALLHPGRGSPRSAATRLICHRTGRRCTTTRTSCSWGSSWKGDGSVGPGLPAVGHQGVRPPPHLVPHDGGNAGPLRARVSGHRHGSTCRSATRSSAGQPKG